MVYVNAPVHDLLIRIKNAYMARKTNVEGVIYSKFKERFLELLQQYHFIKSYKIDELEWKKYLSIRLKTVKNPVDDIPNVKFYSKPSRPRYISYKQIKSVASGKWIWIISTSQWLMPTHIAKTKKIGGELIAEIY